MPEAAPYSDVTGYSLSKRYLSGRAGMLLAEVDGDPSGIVAFKGFDEGRAQLNYFYVKPSARGHGIGHSLMRTSLEAVRAANYQDVVLSTLPKLAAAQAIYKEFGFIRIPPAYPDLPGAEYYLLRLSY